MQITVNVDDTLLTGLHQKYPTSSLEDLVVQGSQKLLQDQAASVQIKNLQAEDYSLRTQFNDAVAEATRDHVTLSSATVDEIKNSDG